MRIGKPALFIILSLLQWAAPGQCQSQDKYEIARGHRPVITSDGTGHIHLAFEAYTTEGKVPDIFYKASTEGGGWSPAQDISKTSGLSQRAGIAVEKNGAIDVVWVDNSSDTRSADIYFARSADGGKTWTKPTDISSTPGTSTEPAIATGADDSIHIVWSDTSKGEKEQDIFYTGTKDHGKNWTPAIDISNTPGASHHPAIAVSPEGTIHAAWSDTASGEKNSDIFYAQGRGDAWAQPSIVSGTKNAGSDPAIACNKEKVFLVWSEQLVKEKAADICLEIGNNIGDFGPADNLTNNSGQSTAPALCLLGDDLAIVWTETAKGSKTPGVKGLTISNNGEKRSPILPISNFHGPAQHADVTIYGGKLYATWEEGVPSNGVCAIQMRAFDLNRSSTSQPLVVDPKSH